MFGPKKFAVYEISFRIMESHVEPFLGHTVYTEKVQVEEFKNSEESYTASMACSKLRQFRVNWHSYYKTIEVVDIKKIGSVIK